LVPAGNRSLTAFYSGHVGDGVALDASRSTPLALSVNAKPIATLSATSISPMVSSPTYVAVGDFNGDGKPDVAVPNLANNTVTVLLGNGSGGFTAASGSPFPTGTRPLFVAVADLNGDGKSDWAIANNTVPGTVTVLLGNGSG